MPVNRIRHTPVPPGKNKSNVKNYLFAIYLYGTHRLSYIQSAFLGCNLLNISKHSKEKQIGHPLRRFHKLNGHTVQSAKTGCVASPEQNEPDKGVAGNFLRPNQRHVELSENNLHKNDKDKENKQKLAQIAFKMVKKCF